MQTRRLHLRPSRRTSYYSRMEVVEPRILDRHTVEVVCEFCGQASDMEIVVTELDGEQHRHCTFTICCEEVAKRAQLNGLGSN